MSGERLLFRDGRFLPCRWERKPPRLRGLGIAGEAVEERRVGPGDPAKNGRCQGQIGDVVEKVNPTKWRERLLSASLKEASPGRDLRRERRDPSTVALLGRMR